MRISFCVSASVSLNTGMPVHIETMSAISSSPIGGTLGVALARAPTAPRARASCCVSLRSVSRRFAAFSNSCASIAASFSRRVSSISSSSSRYTGGEVIDLMRMREAASSMRSIALSGSWRSEM